LRHRAAPGEAARVLKRILDPPAVKSGIVSDNERCRSEDAGGRVDIDGSTGDVRVSETGQGRDFARERLARILPPFPGPVDMGDDAGVVIAEAAKRELDDMTGRAIEASRFDVDGDAGKASLFNRIAGGAFLKPKRIEVANSGTELAFDLRENVFSRGAAALSGRRSHDLSPADDASSALPAHPVIKRAASEVPLANLAGPPGRNSLFHRHVEACELGPSRGAATPHDEVADGGRQQTLGEETIGIDADPDLSLISGSRAETRSDALPNDTRRRRDRRMKEADEFAPAGKHVNGAVQAQTAMPPQGRIGAAVATRPAIIRLASDRVVAHEGIDQCSWHIEIEPETVQENAAQARIPFHAGVDRGAAIEQRARCEHPRHRIVLDLVALEAGPRLGSNERQTNEGATAGEAPDIRCSISVEGILIDERSQRFASPLRRSHDHSHRSSPAALLSSRKPALAGRHPPGSGHISD
jgi:hypothetical protein